GSEPEALSVSHPAQERKIISEPMDRLVANCTALEVNDRPASAKELRARITEVKAMPRGGIIKVPGSRG
ncbi:MAG TPA: hypothetical protein V6D22_10920, partial [Candidatus Obscuribacterales bacterium]